MDNTMFPREMQDSVDWCDPVDRAHHLAESLLCWLRAVPGCRGFGSASWIPLIGQDGWALTSMTPSAAWDGARGRSGGWGSLNFASASSQYVRLSSNLGITGYPFSFSCWVNTTTAATQALVSLLPSASTTAYQTIKVSSTGVAVINARNGGTNITTSGTRTVSDGWHQIGGVFASATLRNLYVDGVFEATSTTSVTFTASNTVLLGNLRVSSPTEFLNGPLDDVFIWNRALGDNDMWDVYEQGLRHYPGLLNRIRRRTISAPAGSAVSVAGIASRSNVTPHRIGV